MQSKATTVAAYLKSLPAERRAVVSAVRRAVNAHLPKGYHETMGYGMISWVIPLSRYPVTYNKQPLMFAALAAQKNGYSLYLMCAYMNKQLLEELRAGFAAAGQKLDMGKSCVRFKKLEQLSLDTVGRIIAAVPVEKYLAWYESSRTS
jgi:hypothetical protein